MKVLLIAYAFPPYPIVGSIRAERLARAFFDAGHDVHVLTARLPDEAEPIRSHGPGPTVEAVRTWPHPKYLYRWARDRLKGNPGGTEGSRASPRFVVQERWQPPERTPSWKRYILSLLHVPDELQGFIPHAFYRGTRAFPGGPDLIYTTSPPASAHLAAWALRVATGARWVAEFRDPWVDNAAKDVRGSLSSPPADALNRWLERRCLARAHRVVAVTDQAGEMIARRMPDSSRPPLVVRNGIGRYLEPPVAEPRDPMRILYVGGVGGNRDPRPFLEAVRILTEAMEEPAARVRVLFVGNCRFYGSVDLEEWVRDAGLQGVVGFRGWVDHQEATALQEEADLLLLLAQKQPAQVPNKLYEYLGARRPILALVDDGGESARMLREVGGHFLVTEREGWETGDALRDAYEAFRMGRRFAGDGPDASVLQAWDAREQMGRLMAELDAMGGRGTS